MNPVDLVVIVILVGGFIWGFSKGFIYMIFSLLAIIVGVLAASRITPLLMPILFSENSTKFGFIILFILLFTLIYFIIRKLSTLVENLVEFLELEWLDSLGGGLLGLFQFLIIAGILMNLLYNVGVIQMIPQNDQIQFAYFVSRVSGSVIEYIAGNLDKFQVMVN